MVKGVLVGHHRTNALVKFLQRTVQAIGDSKLLEMQPEGLAFRQPPIRVS